MMFLSFIAVFFSLLMYFIMGRALVSEKKIFKAQFLYIGFYFFVVPSLHIYYNIHAFDLQFYNFKDAIVSLNTINSIGMIFSLLGFISLYCIKPQKNYIVKEMNWLLLMRLSLVYVFLSFIYFIYLAFTTNIFYIEAKTELENSSLIQYMILESTPIIFAWAVISYLKIKNKKSFFLFFILFVFITIMFSGLRGSRVTVIFNIVSFIIMYSFLIKKINYKYFVLMLIIGFIFNIVYSNYKYSGVEGVKHYLATGEKSSYIESKENETLHFILSDLARSDVQAKIIENIELGQYRPMYIPDTYISGISLVFPDNSYSSSFESKRILGTKAIYGFEGNDDYSSSRIYGLLGEALINFGFYGIPIAFFIYGAIHYLTIRAFFKAKKDNFVLFLPLIFFIPIYLLFYDLDNIVFQIIKNWLLPAILFLAYLGINKVE